MADQPPDTPPATDPHTCHSLDNSHHTTLVKPVEGLWPALLRSWGRPRDSGTTSGTCL